jgi:hypothetical protein
MIQPNLQDPYGEAFRCFERWLDERDPERKMEVLEAATAYRAWTDEHGVERYLDAAQPNGAR